MKNIIRISLIAFIGGALLQSCTKIDAPYATIQSVSSDTNTRTVLLEDYTGHLCTNCAPAAKIANTLQETYEGRVFVIGVHAGSFAKPEASNPYLTADFRCATGNEWYGNSTFYIDQNPKGMVNRRPYNGKMSFLSSTWNDAIAEALEQPKVAVMSMRNTFDSEDSTLSTRINVKFLSGLSQKVNLSACIIEDSIYGGQKNSVAGDSVPLIKRFLFMHILRGSINGTYGEQIAKNPASGTIVTKNYSFDFGGRSWVPRHCYLVAFISDPDTYEVLHVIKSPVVMP